MMALFTWLLPILEYLGLIPHFFPYLSVGTVFADKLQKSSSRDQVKFVASLSRNRRWYIPVELHLRAETISGLHSFHSRDYGIGHRRSRVSENGPEIMRLRNVTAVRPGVNGSHFYPCLASSLGLYWFSHGSVSRPKRTLNLVHFDRQINGSISITQQSNNNPLTQLYWNLFPQQIWSTEHVTW
jgi:hypothetical protein